MSSSRAQNRRERKQQIREAACRCFAESSYNRTRVADICRSAGISKGSFYWYYDSKKSVCIDILDTWASEVQEGLQRRFQMSQTASLDPYSLMAVAILEEARRERRIVIIWLNLLTLASSDEEIREVLHRFHEKAREGIQGVLQSVIPISLRPDELHTLSSTILATFFGLVCQEIGEPHELNLKPTVEHFMRMLPQMLEGAFTHRPREEA